MVADVLAIYQMDKGSEIVTIKKAAGRVKILLSWWGDKTLAQVNGKSCRDYLKFRTDQPIRHAITSTRKVTAQAVRRELQDFRAAINHHKKEGLCSQEIDVWLPERSSPKDVFLTRSEAARLLYAAWTRKEKQKRKHDGIDSDEKVETRKRTTQHIARFILVGLYTGTRHDAICGASFEPDNDRSWIDLKKGVFHRLRQGKKATKKQQPPVRLPDRLMLHLRRWHRLGIAKNAVVEWNGRPIHSVKVGFASCVRDAQLAKHVTPHTLRHTSATWLMDEGCKVWDAAGYLGMSAQVLESTYAKHHPDYQIGMLDAFRSPGARRINKEPAKPPEKV